jgi:hypothetical protein
LKNSSKRLKSKGLYSIIKNGRIGTLIWMKEYDTKYARAFVFFPDPNETICYTFYMKKNDINIELEHNNIELIAIIPDDVYNVYKVNWNNTLPLKEAFIDTTENID